ncbi:unnamed protein product [Effrenium voratum]|nr:unnamed protein product [Effrenium voratum]
MANPADTQFFSEALQANPIVLDSADLGIISRPQTFWTRVSWSKSKHHCLPPLHLDLPLTHPDSIDTEGYKFPRKVQAARMPCLTTPAPDDSGRSAPKKLKGRITPDVKQRWLECRPPIARWHYEEDALMTAPDGSLQTPPAFIKEQMHGLGKHYTQHPDVQDRDRHRMLANSWHVGVATFILVCLL